MNSSGKGFSLVELLLALTVSLALVMMMFQLFHQNERVFRDQTLLMEMQQSARIVASQIADEIRMAGQGVPLSATDFDTVPSEAVAVILGSSTDNRIDFRAGLSNTETATLSGPNDFTLGVSRSVAVGSPAGFTIGKFVYISGPGAVGTRTWLRAELTGVGPSAMTLTPRNSGSGSTAIHFSVPSTVSLEEAVSIFLNDGSVRRATATNLSDPSKPGWSGANEIGQHFKALTFTYYDTAGNIVKPTTLSNRTAIVRVDVLLTVETAAPLTNGDRPTYTLALRSIPRNARLRNAS
jgi:hypothetical protein